MKRGYKIVRKDKAGLDPIKTPTMLDVAWAAGIYEGEGSCVAGGHGKNSFSVTVAQKDPEFLYRLRDLFGGGVKFYNVGKQGRFEIYHWVVCGDRARAFLGAIYPYLTSRRKAQIEHTSVRVFFEKVQDLLHPVLASEPCKTYALLTDRIREHVTGQRRKAAEHKKKRADNYYAIKSQDPAWMKHRRLATAKWRKSRKEQHQVEAQKIVAIA